MSKFDEMVKSKVRILDLEKEIINAIEVFSNKNPDLTMNEVGAVMLKLLTDSNNKEIKDSII